MHFWKGTTAPTRRHAGLVAAAAVTLGLTMTLGPSGPASAHGDEGNAQKGAEQGSSGPACTAKEKRRLEHADDNFSAACLPGADLAQMEGHEPELGVGEEASSRNVKRIATIPKQGPFAETSSFNSDLAFQGRYAFAGNYNGFTVFDIKKAKSPKVVAQVLCPGGQGDVSVYGDILVMSVDSPRSSSSCQSDPSSTSNPSAWEGLRVFDISDPRAPQYVSAVKTACGSHTHTLAPDQADENLYVYVSSYFPSTSNPNCPPPHDKISVVKVPVASPRDATLVATPVLFPEGGNPGDGYSFETTGCHDITAYPEKDIAAGACMGDGILLDISDRENPVVTEQVRDEENFFFWHSATFNNDGTKVVFTDELGGGGGAECNPDVGPTRGADGIYDIEDGQLVFKSYYQIARTNGDTENCVAHNGSLIPVPGKDIMVQAWYQGGVSIWDFTDSANPREIGWFDRGPLANDRLVLGGSWSAYYYNGHIYSNDIQKGFDVLEIKDKLTNPAKKIRMDAFNAQSQPSYNG